MCGGMSGFVLLLILICLFLHRELGSKADEILLCQGYILDIFLTHGLASAPQFV